MYEDFFSNPATMQSTPLQGMNYTDYIPQQRTIQSSWAQDGAYVDPATGRLTVPPNIPPMGTLFNYGQSSGGGQLSPQAAAQATAERTKALGQLEGRAAGYWNTPLAQGAQNQLLGVMNGTNLPYSQSVQNQMFTQSADQIAAAQNAARQRAYAQAGASGMGTGGAFQNQLAAGAGNAAVQRQGALAGIQNRAAMGNFSAQQQAAGMANSMLGTGYGVTNPLVQQAASARFNTDWGSGIGSDLGGGSNAAAGTGGSLRYNVRRTGLPTAGRNYV